MPRKKKGSDIDISTLHPEVRRVLQNSSFEEVRDWMAGKGNDLIRDVDARLKARDEKILREDLISEFPDKKARDVEKIISNVQELPNQNRELLQAKRADARVVDDVFMDKKARDRLKMSVANLRQYEGLKDLHDRFAMLQIEVGDIPDMSSSKRLKNQIELNAAHIKALLSARKDELARAGKSIAKLLPVAMFAAPAELLASDDKDLVISDMLGLGRIEGETSDEDLRRAIEDPTGGPIGGRLTMDQLRRMSNLAGGE